MKSSRNFRFSDYLRDNTSQLVWLNLLNLFVPNAPFPYPLKTKKKPQGFLMFSGGRERVHWERMG